MLMTGKLHYVETTEHPPKELRDAHADAVLDRGLVDEKIAAGESSYAADGGAPIEEVFARLIAKYG